MKKQNLEVGDLVDVKQEDHRQAIVFIEGSGKDSQYTYCDARYFPKVTEFLEFFALCDKYPDISAGRMPNREKDNIELVAKAGQWHVVNGKVLPTEVFHAASV